MLYDVDILSKISLPNLKAPRLILTHFYSFYYLIYSSLLFSLFNLLTLSSAALAAAASSVVLTVESSDLSVNGAHLQSIHFGAGINGVLLTSSPVSYSLNSTDSTLYESVEVSDGSIPFVLGENLGQLVTEAGAISIPAKLNDDGYLTISGSTTAAYACDKLSWDPYGYASAERRGVAVFTSTQEVPEYCTPIKIKSN